MSDSPPSQGKGLHGFLNATTAGLPNYVWLLVVGAGIAAAYVIPRFFKSSSSSSSPTTTGNDGTSGIGLAVDPTTGLPYAVEGLVPSGNAYAGGGSTTTTPIGTTATGGTTTTTGGGGSTSTTDNDDGTQLHGTPIISPVNPAHNPGDIFRGPTGVYHYDANGNQTLSQIASALGLPGWNSIYAIPDNQRLFGALNSQQAANYKPARGEVITIAPPWPGGTQQQRMVG